jgi:hypothetical protein
MEGVGKDVAGSAGLKKQLMGQLYGTIGHLNRPNQIN